MIVRNEQELLHDCLQSVCDIVDEIIVVDTGSGDRTREIARSFGASVFDFAWCDDFAAARNESVRHARGKWILQLDADERLQGNCAGDLEKWLARDDIDFVSVLIDSPTQKHASGHVSRAHRLFRNVPGVCYAGRIHEQVSPFFLERGGREGMSAIMLYHLGYDPENHDSDRKWRRNHRLLKRQLEEQPEHPYWHFSLAQNLMRAKRYREAMQYLISALSLGGLPEDLLCTIHNNLAEIHFHLGDYASAVAEAQISLEINNRQAMAFLLLYQVYEALRNPVEQISCLENVITIVDDEGREQGQVALDAYVDPNALYLNLANRYLNAGRYAEAKNYYKKITGHQKTLVMGLKGLSECHIQLGEYEDALGLLERIKALAPEDPLNFERLAWVAIKLGDYHQAIENYVHLKDLVPGNKVVLRRLATLYYKIGKAEKGKALLLNSKVNIVEPQSAVLF
jgi:glycosyltransferase involved in cell wall biosynthesis